jgi:hypothetical protein
VIIRELHTEGKENNPTVGCEVSIWINAALRVWNEAIEQFHSEPQVPIIAVGAYVRERLDLFVTAKFLPVLVFDGLLNPFKKVADSSRYAGVSECKEKLKKIYNHEIEADYAEVLRLQKNTDCIRNDLLHTVLQVSAEYREDVRIIGSPIDADATLASLDKQPIFDYVCTTDSDLTTCSARNVIGKLTSGSKC